jgi:hypothetical protein
MVTIDPLTLIEPGIIFNKIFCLFECGSNFE